MRFNYTEKTDNNRWFICNGLICENVVDANLFNRRMENMLKDLNLINYLED